MASIMVSVYCATYNHEQFIIEALNSILMQKVNFTIEVLVGEDCSTDNTRNVLKQYEKRHPNQLVIFYRDHNMSKDKIKNSMDLRLRCKGKYIIALEGDDYWTDVYKLQKQVDFLESHPEYIGVAHNCIVVGADSQPNGESFLECKQNDYTLMHYLTGIMPGQTTTLLYRNIYKDNILDKSFVDNPIMPGDRRLFFSLVANGRIYCIQEVMSAYRHIISKGSSYSASFKRDFNRSLKWYLAQLEYAKKLDNMEALKCAELLYLLTVRDCILKKDISIRDGIKRLKAIDHKVRTIVLLAKRDINRFVLKRELDL